MFSLNLPSFVPKISEKNGKHLILDPIRKKYVTLTPEEWVRQHWVRWLIDYQNIPLTMIQVEKQIFVGQKQKRFDLVVYQNNGTIWLLMEFKQPHLPISQDVLNQINQYNLVLKSNYMLVSNGIEHHLFETLNFEINFLKQLPSYK